jgi:hypothetical protein
MTTIILPEWRQLSFPTSTNTTFSFLPFCTVLRDRNHLDDGHHRKGTSVCRFLQRRRESAFHRTLLVQRDAAASVRHRSDESPTQEEYHPWVGKAMMSRKQIMPCSRTPTPLADGSPPAQFSRSHTSAAIGITPRPPPERSAMKPRCHRVPQSHRLLTPHESMTLHTLSVLITVYSSSQGDGHDTAYYHTASGDSQLICPLP